MQYIAILIGAIFISLIEWFAQFFSKKVAITLTLVTFVTTATAALIVTVDALVSSIAVTLPAQATAFVGAFLPPNTIGCISAVVAAKLARMAYDYNVKFAEYINGNT